MDVFEAIRGRRSCRRFLPDPVTDEMIRQILEAAVWAPSPANNQPWGFVVITNPDVRKRIYEESLVVKKALFEKSGWGWVDRYKADFLLEAPVLVAVVGDSEKTGAHKFHEGTETVYQHACAAAIQNMLLAAHALGLGSLWFTLFDRAVLAEILGIGPSRLPLALICLGMPAGEPIRTPRGEAADRTTFIR